MTAIVPRATVEDIVAQRNAALAGYGLAHARLSDAYQALARAHAAVPGNAGSTSYDVGASEQAKALLPVVAVPAREDFLASARYLTDRRVWGHIIGLTDLERLMDKAARDQLRQQLMREPPEVTVANVVATLESFVADAGMIFRRGLANAFSALDRRFRSHDGWKIGSRIILDHALSEWGSWNYHQNKRDELRDVERTFFVLDGRKPPANDAGIVGAVEASRGGMLRGARQSEAETDYFVARCFKNGNLHLWFKRDDLLARVNQLLGEYYGAPIPHERGPDKDDGLHDLKLTPAKRHGFFPTPDAAARTLVDGALLGRPRDGDPRLSVLEPSAGTGNLARLCRNAGAHVECVEIQPDLASGLRQDGFRTITDDFLALQPNSAWTFDRVVMNPPFDRERDIDHVMHAMKFLKPGGFLSAIMSSGTEFRDTRKSAAFRALMAEKNAVWRDLPPGSFASVGTYCNTLILRVWADGRRFWA